MVRGSQVLLGKMVDCPYEVPAEVSLLQNGVSTHMMSLSGFGSFVG